MNGPNSINHDIQAGDGTRSPERRQLTVVYCDLIGSTALFTELDPEEVSEILRTYHQCCTVCIEAAGGFVAQFQGDGVIGFFGYTQATESDAERAVRAALDLVANVPGLRSVEDRSLSVRIGISTGLAVVGDTLREGTRLEQGAVGQVLHIAARLQAVAGANEILVTDVTKQLAGRLFVWRSRGRISFKGMQEPVAVWNAVRPRLTASRPGMRRGPPLTPIVGREAELDSLIEAWRRAVAGQGKVVNIVGAAGMGKSRLLHEFRRRIGPGRPVWIEGGGAQFFAQTPFHVLSQLIRRALYPSGQPYRFDPRPRLEMALAEAGVQAGAALPLLTEIVGERAPDVPLSVTPEERSRLLLVLAEWLVAAARRTPMVVVLEDLHWMDPSSQEVDSFIAQRIGNSPLLMVRTMRPGHTSSSVGKEQSAIQLGPLNDGELRRVISGAAGGVVPLTEQDIAKILRRAQGVPLFGIELARLVGAKGEDSGEHKIPETLNELLAARLDQVGAAKAVAQTASVIGDDIYLSLLAAVSAMPPRRLQAHLATLMKYDVLVRKGTSEEPVFAFTHALLRDAAYAGLLRGRRRTLHRQVAVAMGDRFVETAAFRPELVAHHWTEAAEWQQSFNSWQEAGKFASARRAFQEAEQAYQNAVTAVLALPESPERDVVELEAQSALADVLRITRGFSAPRTEDATARAGVLADQQGDRTQQFLQMWGHWTAASSAGKYASASEVADRFYQLALVDGTDNDRAYAHMMHMTSKYRTGKLSDADDRFRQGERYFGLAEFRRRPGVIAQTYGNASLIAWIRGDDAAAHVRMEHALAVARENDNPFDHAYADHMAATLAILTGEFEKAADLARSSVTLSDKHNFPQFAANSRIALGRTQTSLGAIEDGKKLIQDGLARMLATPQRVSITLYFFWLAEAHVASRSFENALAATKDSLDINPQELFFKPESVRLRGEIAARLGDSEEAKRSFRKALALSAEIGADRFGERAANSLKRLLQERVST